ncbi:hypothetical protein D6853_10230 [Butyrivibrio sp. X503]|uniref:hypothetical protein n=1 Tax=Butyrivibrio sp. X503 TaxID=2364878 RepID=UPI000EAAB80A|nr:hypothetical protein [Butyrivibrio sp. X503]RKM55106.1 hypothetical protein D6853_10230 [Butyrivibrio sp. X503]
MGFNDGKFYDAKLSMDYYDALKFEKENFDMKADGVRLSNDDFEANEQFDGEMPNYLKRFVKYGGGKMLNDNTDTYAQMINDQRFIMNSFESIVDPSPNARLEINTLEKINTDFKAFHKRFDEIARETHQIVDDLNREFGGEIDGGFPQPESRRALASFEDICGGYDPGKGFFKECQDKLLEFDATVNSALRAKDTRMEVADLNKRIQATKNIIGSYIYNDPNPEKIETEGVGDSKIKEVKILNKKLDYFCDNVNKYFDNRAEIDAVAVEASPIDGNFLCSFDKMEGKKGPLPKAIIKSPTYGPYKKIVTKIAKRSEEDPTAYTITPQGAALTFGVGGAMQSYIEKGDFSDLGKNAKANYEAFQQGSVNYMIDKVAGTRYIPGRVQQVAHAIQGKVYDINLPDATGVPGLLNTSTTAAGMNDQIKDIWSTFREYMQGQGSGKGVNVSAAMNNFFQGAGYTTLFGSSFFGSKFANKQGTASTKGANSKSMTVSMVGSKGVKTTPQKEYDEKVSGNQSNVSGIKDDEKPLYYDLHQYGFSDAAILEALKNGISPDKLLELCKSFDTEEASIFLNLVLEQKYEEAFSYLSQLDNPEALINDYNLMSALSLYSFNIPKIDNNGDITAQSQEKFAAFMSGILNAQGPFKNYSVDIFKQMYINSSILAVAYNDSVLLTDIEKVGEETYKRMCLEAEKRMTITNFYATESVALKETSLATGGEPEASVDIISFSTGKLEIDNCLTYERVNSKKETEKYRVSVTQHIDAGSINDKEAGIELNELIKKRDKLVNKLVTDVLKDTSYAIHPLLGYSVRLICDITAGNESDTLDDATRCVNEILKTTSDKKINSGIIGGISVAGDFYDYFKEYNKISDEIEGGKQGIRTDWFGYRYSYDYDTYGGIFAAKHETDFTSVTSNPIRPDAYQLMKEWEAGGINSLIANSDVIKDPDSVVNSFDEKFKTRIDNSNLDQDQIELAKKLVYGGEDLDLRSVDYADFNACINFLDEVYQDTGDGGCFGSVHALWDSRIQQFGGR